MCIWAQYIVGCMSVKRSLMAGRNEQLNDVLKGLSLELYYRNIKDMRCKSKAAVDIVDYRHEADKWNNSRPGKK
jgi:hypothetical protein